MKGARKYSAQEVKQNEKVGYIEVDRIEHYGRVMD